MESPKNNLKPKKKTSTETGSVEQALAKLEIENSKTSLLFR